MRTRLSTAALALAIASTIGITGAIGQAPRPAQPKEKPAPNRPQVQGQNLFVRCALQASQQRLLPGSEARRRFMRTCQGQK
jgi:hypothetical protein